MKRLVLGLTTLGILSINCVASENEDFTKKARNIQECDKLYKYYTSNEQYYTGGKIYFAKNNKLLSCVKLKHVPSMCSVAGSIYDGKKGFEKNRRKGYKLAQKAISINKEEAVICNLNILNWNY